jgi:hypothetical protein
MDTSYVIVVSLYNEPQHVVGPFTSRDYAEFYAAKFWNDGDSMKATGVSVLVVEVLEQVR